MLHINWQQKQNVEIAMIFWSYPFCARCSTAGWHRCKRSNRLRPMGTCEHLIQWPNIGTQQNRKTKAAKCKWRANMLNQICSLWSTTVAVETQTAKLDDATNRIRKQDLWQVLANLNHYDIHSLVMLCNTSITLMLIGNIVEIMTLKCQGITFHFWKRLHSRNLQNQFLSICLQSE